MTTSAINAATATGATATPARKKNTLDQTDFLKMFVTQLKFQDPLAPMDNYQMASQMAQFSMVDSLNSMTGSIKSLESSQSGVNNLQAASLVGKNVEVKGNMMTVGQAKVTEGSYQLEKPGKVTITVLDDKGGLVRVLEAGARDTQKQKILWDGKNQQGVPAPDGKYTFQVAAVDEKGASLKATTTMVGPVEGVSFDQGKALLKIGTQQVPLTDIIAVLA